jgi:alpha/beta superfamily hydrolase
VCFNHGKESGPWGSKIERMAQVARERGYQVMSPDYQGMDAVDARLETLRRQLPSECDELVLVGSSMGAYVAAAASVQRAPDGLFLLAPAVYMPGYESDDLDPSAGSIMVVHGWHDEIVPVDNAIRWCRHHSLPLLLLDSDHRLMSALDTICRQFGQFLDRVAATCCS